MERFKRGDYEDEDIQQEVLEKWIAHILEQKETAEETKNTIIDFEAEINKKENSLYTEVKYNELSGLSEDFEQLFAEKDREVAEMFSAVFGLDDYVEMINAVYKEMENEYFMFSCAADGETLIYTCTFKDDGVTKEEAYPLKSWGEHSLLRIPGT